MNKYIFMLILGFVVIPAHAEENVKTKHYKCFVEYTGGGEGVQYVSSKRATSVQAVTRMLTKGKILSSKTGKAAWVYNVKECVKSDGRSTFNNETANRLDKEFGR